MARIITRTLISARQGSASVERLAMLIHAARWRKSRGKATMIRSTALYCTRCSTWLLTPPRSRGLDSFRLDVPHGARAADHACPPSRTVGAHCERRLKGVTRLLHGRGIPAISGESAFVVPRARAGAFVLRLRELRASSSGAWTPRSVRPTDI